MLYADGKSKVGNVRVYACPKCEDGSKTVRLLARVLNMSYALSDSESDWPTSTPKKILREIRTFNENLRAIVREFKQP